jgi:hypothetical protein
MSDSGVETESALLANGLNLHSDIVVKGQHHSGNSCSGPFLDVVRPRLIIATSRDFPPNERISDMVSPLSPQRVPNRPRATASKA